jgi:predicted deacylase
MSAAFWSDLPPGFHQRRCVIEGELGFEVFIWRGVPADDSNHEPVDEKVLLLNGASHGDEWEGPVVLTEWVHMWRPQNLRGTVVIVPVLHEAAFYDARRESPMDGKNLARAFPGDASGTATEKIAHAFQSQFIEHTNYYADFHSAGAAYEIWPWAGYIMTDDEAILAIQRGMACCFPSVWHWGTPYIAGRTISAAKECGVPAIYIECQGKGGMEESDGELLRAGIENLTRHLGFIEGEYETHEPDGVRESKKGEEGHLQVENPAPCDGILTQIMPAGGFIKNGDVLATVQPLDNGKPQEIRSRQNGRVVMVRRFRAVKAGETLAVVVEV